MRLVSRTEFRHLPREAALALLRGEFGAVVNVRPWGGLAQRLPGGDRIVKYLGDFDASVVSGSGRHARTLLVDSATPLLGESSSVAGTLRARRYVMRAHAATTPPPDAVPVNLTLANLGSFLAPVSSAVPVRIPENAGGTISFPNQSLGVSVVGADTSAATVLGGTRVAYTSALPDTDLLVTPEDVGAEVSWQARSAESPTTVELALSLPAGGSLTASRLVPGGVDVMVGGKAIATVNPAQATDAAGNPVPSSLTFSGNVVSVHVSLAGSGVQFPVLVDPLVSVQDSYRLLQDGSGQRTNSSDPFAGWAWGQGGSSSITGWTNGAATGSAPGMAVYNLSGSTINDGSYGEWVYTAPGTSFIQRADFGYMNLNLTGSDPGWACMFEGIVGSSGWLPGDWSEYVNGNSSVETWGANPTLDCGNYSYPNLPDGQANGTFRSYCVGANSFLTGNPLPVYDGYSYDGYRYFTVNGTVTAVPTTQAMSPPAQTADCNAEWPARSDQGTSGDSAVWGLQFSQTGRRNETAVAGLYGADIYLSQDTSPTITTPDDPNMPGATTWVDSLSGSLCSGVTDGVCQSGDGPIARDSGLGVTSEGLVTPVGSPTIYTAPNQITGSGACTGAPYHSPCPKLWVAPVFNYSTASWPEGPQTMTLYAWNPMGWTPPPATQAYLLHIDHQAPNAATLSGPLWDDRATNLDGSTNASGSSSSDPLTGSSYQMQVTGVDPGNASGPAEIDVSVDGGTPQVFQAPCQAISSSDPATQCGALTSGNRTDTVDYTFQNDDYAAGSHTVCVTVLDQVAQQQESTHPIANCKSGTSIASHTSQASFTVYTQPDVSLGSSQSQGQNDQLGLEDFYDYRQLATGAGSYARVNLANGNLVWDDIPVVDPGQGLSTFVEVAYNSQHRLGELASLLGQPLLPTGEYNQIGQGFSLGIDGLTRLNEPLDLSLEPLGRISFTDVDGTYHTFVQDPGDPQHWISPPGVFLWLRQWSSTDPTKAWAITRPDGVTYFFDQAGYETSIEDRQTNTVTFKLQSLVLNLQTGSTTPCSAPLPILGSACSERVTDVVDQSGQDMHVCYYDTATESNCPGQPVAGNDPRLLKVEDIIDHAGRDLHFDYDQSGDLTAMTVNATQSDPDQKQVFSFGYGGGNDAQPGVGGLPGLSDLLPSVFPPGLTQITDPNGHATTIRYAAAQALSSSDPCPRDLSDPLPLQLGGLVGLEPKCVVQLTDRGGGETNFSYTTGTDSSGNEIHTATVQGPRTDPPGSSTRPDQWIDTTDVYGRPIEEQDPLSRTTLLTWNDTGQSQPANTLAKLVQASGTPDQVTTLYSYDQNGRLTDQQGPADTASGSDERQNFREVKIAYRLSPGTLLAPSGADTVHCSSSDTSMCFVSDPISLTNQDGETTSFTLDPGNPADGLVTQITDPAGKVWSTTYDQYGRVTSQTEPGTGNGPETTSYGNFDPYTGQPQTVTLPTDPANGSEASVWHYAYDKLGNLLAVTDPRNTSLSASAPALTTPGSAYTTVFTYDALSRMTAEYDSKDSASTPGSYITRTYTYDPNNNLTARTSGNGKAFTYVYTPMDWLASESTPAVTQADGTTKAAEVTSYCYDEQGDMTDEVQPLGQPAMCALGQPAATNHATHMVYDGDGELLVSEQMATGTATNELTSYAYDNRGDQVGMADPAANYGSTIAQAESNAQSATSGTVGPTWRTRTYYDAAGDPIETVQNPNASDGTVYVSRNQYDASGLLLASENARGPSVSTDPTTGEFDLSASPVVADTTTYGYDSQGLLDSVTDPAGDTTQTERAPDGKICAITAPNGPSGVAESDCSASPGTYKTTFSYYAQGWLKQVGLPTAPNENWYGSEPMTIAYTRDAAGYPTTITDPRGNAITNTFYDNGELKSTNRPSWWTYDPQGTGTPSPDPNTGGQGQVSSDTPGGGLPIREKTLQELYQTASSQQNETLPSDNQAGKFGQVDPEALPGILPPAGETKFAYDGDGNLTSVADAEASNTTPDLQGTTTIDYDELDEPIEIDQPFDGTDLTKTYYGYDADGNQIFSYTPAVTGAGQSPSDTTYRTTNTYDGLDRLTETDAPGTQASVNDNGITHAQDELLLRAGARERLVTVHPVRSGQSARRAGPGRHQRPDVLGLREGCGNSAVKHLEQRG